MKRKKEEGSRDRCSAGSERRFISVEKGQRLRARRNQPKVEARKMAGGRPALCLSPRQQRSSWAELIRPPPAPEPGRAA